MMQRIDDENGLTSQIIIEPSKYHDSGTSVNKAFYGFCYNHIPELAQDRLRINFRKIRAIKSLLTKTISFYG